MYDGYIKLWRILLDSQVWKCPDLLKVWVWCLLKANHEEKWVDVITGKGITEVKVSPGQFIFGRNIASKELSMKPTSIRKRMIKLKSIGNIDMQSDTHYSIVSIINWSLYQQDKIKKGQARGHPSDTQVTPKGHPGDTNKNDKNDKNDKNKNKYSESFENFWKAYPNKKEKKDCYKVWLKLKPDIELVEKILSAIQKQKEWRDNASRSEFIPEWKHPTTWLNKGCWEDEVIEMNQRKTRSAPVTI